MVVSVLKKVTEGGISSSSKAAGSSTGNTNLASNGDGGPVAQIKSDLGVTNSSSTSTNATTSTSDKFSQLNRASVGKLSNNSHPSNYAEKESSNVADSNNMGSSTFSSLQSTNNATTEPLNVKLNPSNSDDSYFGKVSEYVSDGYIYAKDTVVGSFSYAASSTTDQFYNIFSTGSTSIDPEKSNTALTVSNAQSIDPSSDMNIKYQPLYGKKKSSRSWFRKRSVYDSVTGRNDHRPLPNNSVTAVRNLVQLVKVEESLGISKSALEIYNDTTTPNFYSNDDQRNADSASSSSHHNSNNHQPFMESITSTEEMFFDHGVGARSNSNLDLSVKTDTESQPSLSHIHHDAHNINMDHSLQHNLNGMKENQFTSSLQSPPNRHSLISQLKKNKKISNEETASRLGEGTIRALRDIALDEALELHQCLRFWTERLERPMLFYLEFAPRLLLEKDEGHFIAGQNVSQLQAVLARRCSSIGELQQHIWRAGWQSGVAQWGILGQGSEFAAVIGGGQEETEEQNYNQQQSSSSKSFNEVKRKNYFFSSIRRNRNSIKKGADRDNDYKGVRKNEYREGSDYTIDSLLHVMNQKGGKIMKNNSALAAWSIDAIRVVRDQLYNAGSGVAPLPSFKNWPREKKYFTNDKNHLRDKRRPTLGDSMMSMEDMHLFNHDKEVDDDLPLWATIDIEHDHPSGFVVDGKEENGQVNKHTTEYTITNIELMADEVNGILNSMEKYMGMQRKRRLLKLKPPSRLSRKWYIVVSGALVTGYIAYKLLQGSEEVSVISKLAPDIYAKIQSFFAEHLSEPIESIYRELFTRKGREEITDRKARQEVILSLQRMIKSWLDDAHPEMTEQERINKANAMDVTLIEAKKESSIQSITEVNTIYRLSLIEMQFIKKEMMNALYAMDELMGSNEINMRLTSMTPAFLLVSSCRYVIKKIYYALFKLGKSKEQVYASFRHIILDIERLLVMRDNPPLSPPPLPTGVQYHRDDRNNANTNMVSLSSLPAHSKSTDENYLNNLTDNQSQTNYQNILSADDLGMLMLLVHECRLILWQDRRRFTRQELRNVSEDLAELAGERGAVSVQQQLRIIARMCRTYSFLKVISSGIPFSNPVDY